MKDYDVVNSLKEPFRFFCGFGVTVESENQVDHTLLALLTADSLLSRLGESDQDAVVSYLHKKYSTNF